MNVLILGGDGMLGHKAFELLRARFALSVSFRGSGRPWLRHTLYAAADPRRLFGGIDAADPAAIGRLFERARPDAVVNCIGLVKQRAAASDPVASLRVNALFPQQLAGLCALHGARLIHISTDCVFSGLRGHYTEDDAPDPVDLYGRSKWLGEPDQPGCLVLRTSLIGWELQNRLGLVEWFAAQRGRTIRGYRRALFSGVTTAVLAQLIGDMLEQPSRLAGLYHLAAEPISKYDLLVGLRDALGWDDIRIEPDESVHIDRSLDAARFCRATGWTAPAWAAQLESLARERTLAANGAGAPT